MSGRDPPAAWRVEFEVLASEVGLVTTDVPAAMARARASYAQAIED